MGHSLIIRPEAERDMAEARDWYDRQREGLGSAFILAIDTVFNQIRQSPDFANLRKMCRLL